MVDDNSMLYRQMSSGETGTVPLSVAGVEVGCGRNWNGEN